LPVILRHDDGRAGNRQGCDVPDYVIRFLGPLMIVAAMAASHPASQTALDALSDQVALAWNQLARTDGDCTTFDDNSCVIASVVPATSRPASDRQISF
jgi:hypothetical protein